MARGAPPPRVRAPALEDSLSSREPRALLRWLDASCAPLRLELRERHRNRAEVLRRECEELSEAVEERVELARGAVVGAAADDRLARVEEQIEQRHAPVRNLARQRDHVAR